MTGGLAACGPHGGAFAGLQRVLSRHPLPVQVVRFAAVGGFSTAVNAAFFLVLRLWFGAVPANLIALVLSTAVSTEVNRRFTFGGVHGHRWRANVQVGGTVLFYACYTSAVLLLLAAFVDEPTPLLESAVIAAASVVGGLCRFVVLRYWVFGPDDEVPAEVSR